MKHRRAVLVVLACALLGGGCATKKYVTQTTDPVRSKVDQVAEQTNKQGATLDQTVKEVERHETEISATREEAKSAEGRATDALAKADAAGQKAEQNTREIGEIRQAVSSLDDYKVAAKTVVLFGFNKDTLTPQSKEQLDKLVADASALKRYFIAVEGFTDQTGPADYNVALSRRRADRVLQYLVGQHSIPVYRIQLVGLGKQKPVDEGRSRAARTKNRRVEVTVYSADSSLAAIQKPK